MAEANHIKHIDTTHRYVTYGNLVISLAHVTDIRIMEEFRPPKVQVGVEGGIRYTLKEEAAKDILEFFGIDE